jgi:Protein of unknown function (DUF3300)
MPGQENVVVILLQRTIAFLLLISLLAATAPTGLVAQGDQTSPSSPIPVARQTPEQLQQLVAPIALYPDELVAQILAASTYPAEVVEADRWITQHSDLKGEELAQEVDKQPWDPSVKALTQFPSVLANMDKNLSWTSSLGDAYVNQQQDVMDAVQAMRSRAQSAGNLNTTPQQTVTTQGQTIVIQPADPEVVYVPQYDPWLAYGAPVIAWPGWYGYPGLYLAGPGIAFGLGFGLGFFGGYGWGWHHWGFDWDHRRVIYNHNTYISHSRTFVNRNNFNRGRGGFDRGAGFHGAAPPRGSFGGEHGFTGSHNQAGTHSGAFSGFNHGGVTMGHSAGGRASFGGGFHGGGFHGGGGRR